MSHDVAVAGKRRQWHIGHPTKRASDSVPHASRPLATTTTVLSRIRVLGILIAEHIAKMRRAVDGQKAERIEIAVAAVERQQPPDAGGKDADALPSIPGEVRGSTWER